MGTTEHGSAVATWTAGEPWSRATDGLPPPPIPGGPVGWRTRQFTTVLILDAATLARLHRLCTAWLAAATPLLLPEATGGWLRCGLLGPPDIVAAGPGRWRVGLDFAVLDGPPSSSPPRRE